MFWIASGFFVFCCRFYFFLLRSVSSSSCHPLIHFPQTLTPRPNDAVAFIRKNCCWGPLHEITFSSLRVCEKCLVVTLNDEALLYTNHWTDYILIYVVRSMVLSVDWESLPCSWRFPGMSLCFICDSCSGALWQHNRWNNISSDTADTDESN